MYAELNCKFDYCQKCGYSGEIQIKGEPGSLYWECPNCGNTDQKTMNITRRTCGYLGTNYWNQGRTEEIRDRVLHLDVSGILENKNKKKKKKPQGKKPQQPKDAKQQQQQPKDAKPQQQTKEGKQQQQPQPKEGKPQQRKDNRPQRQPKPQAVANKKTNNAELQQQ